MWSPITALICLVGMIVADVIMGFTVGRIFGLGVGALWLGLALYNWRTGGAFVRGLYASDEEPTARVVESDRRE
jgi:hypothetical protein